MIYNLAGMIQKYPSTGLYGHAITQTSNIRWANYQRQDGCASSGNTPNMPYLYVYSISIGSGLPMYLNCPFVVWPEATGIVAYTVKVGAGKWW
jgi:hypothetical protein